MNKGGFSWKRFLGISQAKARISRQIGIPLTRSGRQRKIGAAMGCLISAAVTGKIDVREGSRQDAKGAKK